MAWKLVNACRYFYESTVVDGDRVEICWGKGPEAFAAAIRVEREHVENREDKALMRAWRKRDAAIDAQVQLGTASLQRELHATLTAAGLHQHKRQWRKRRKLPRTDKAIEEFREKIMTNERKREPSPPSENSVNHCELEDSIRAGALGSLRETGYGEERVAEMTLEVNAKIEEILTTFSCEGATPFERLLTEQIATAWVQWYVASTLLDSASFAARSWRQNQYLEQRYQRCQARLSRVVDQLGRIRCIPRCYLVLGRRSP